jgi:antitoxin HicB
VGAEHSGGKRSAADSVARPSSLPARLGPSTMKVMKRKPSRALSYSVFYQHAPEGGYVALVPALPGCHTQGETLEEAERNVKEAAALYLESLVAHGEPIPEEGLSFQGRVSVPASVPA